ncbi:VanZ family protein [Bacillus sp. V5-8f]|uniref:VanZ family protein n=1 Tax=Bacillus sp. V5-8f TaxID=2053044 RepID=UPI000C76E2F3|nr:VanZ family protein [Bacillus sp. V5-8f]PLT35750.1 hypothetical protein CUU64_00275 [Bacillus sp. V5-8f]
MIFIKKAAFIGSVLLILYFTMRSHTFLEIGTQSGGVNTTLFRSIQTEVSRGFYLNTVGNIILFIPYGLALGLIFKENRLIKAAAAGAALSTAIELIQIFMPNRWTDIDDVMLNTFGTLIGCMAAFLFPWIKK